MRHWCPRRWDNCQRRLLLPIQRSLPSPNRKQRCPTQRAVWRSGNGELLMRRILAPSDQNCLLERTSWAQRLLITRREMVERKHTEMFQEQESRNKLLLLRLQEESALLAAKVDDAWRQSTEASAAAEDPARAAVVHLVELQADHTCTWVRLPLMGGGDGATRSGSQVLLYSCISPCIEKILKALDFRCLTYKSANHFPLTHFQDTVKPNSRKMKL